jgi:uroporphyrin-III C-methyltransferase
MAVVGHVSIVGAGPGDPSLLTRRAVARLRAADLVLYDALVDLVVLRFARRAQKFFVGKRAGRHAVSQDAIHTLMIRAARKGKRVVRLKGGDPFVFGRGGEEALALRAASVSFDIVPGLTNAVAAPGLAGIPVTHRGTSSGVVIVSGHEETAFASAVGRLAPNGLTLVILMGIGRSAGLAGRLIDLGWSRATPAAIVADASLPSQRMWYGTLGDLASARPGIDVVDVARAGTIVVGAVAALQCRAGREGSARGPSEAPEGSVLEARRRGRASGGGAPRASE